MVSGRGNLHSPSYHLLSFDIGEITAAFWRFPVERGDVHMRWRGPLRRLEKLHGFEQMADTEDIHPVDDPGFRCAFGGHEDIRALPGPSMQCHWQGAMYSSSRIVKHELPDNHDTAETLPVEPIGCRDHSVIRRVERGPLLMDTGR